MLQIYILEIGATIMKGSLEKQTKKVIFSLFELN